MADLADLSNVIEEEQAAASEIPVNSLTEFEKSALKAQGVDLSGPTVRVRKTLPKKITPPVDMPTKDEIRKLESPAAVEVKQPEPVVEEPPKPREPAYTKQDAQEYVRCLLSLKPFKKTYEVLSGNAQVTFASRTAQENMILATLLRDLRTKNGMGNADVTNVAWLAFQFVYTAKQVMVGGNVIEVTKPDSLDYEVIRKNTLDNLAKIPLPIYKQLVAKLLDFELVVADLEAKADDPNFWDLTDA